MFKILLLFPLVLGVTIGMDCSLGTSENVFQKIVHTCPRPLLDSSDEEYCCPESNGSVKCCNLQNFIFQWSLMVWPYILLVLLILTILSCICCCLRHLRLR